MKAMISYREKFWRLDQPEMSNQIFSETFECQKMCASSSSLIMEQIKSEKIGINTAKKAQRLKFLSVHNRASYPGLLKNNCLNIMDSVVDYLSFFSNSSKLMNKFELACPTTSNKPLRGSQISHWLQNLMHSIRDVRRKICIC